MSELPPLPPPDEWASCEGKIVPSSRRYLAATVQAYGQQCRDSALIEVEGWKQLYLRAINCANGLTNYVENRPELRSIERALEKIESDAAMLRAKVGKIK